MSLNPERRELTPEQLYKAAELLVRHPDLEELEAKLARLERGPEPLRPRTFKELVDAVDRRILTAGEAHFFLALPRRRGLWERLLTWSVWPVQESPVLAWPPPLEHTEGEPS